MEKLEELFDKRFVFAAKLEQIMEDRSLTKARLCKDSNISRPTLDKLLAGEITNKVTFERHAAKLIDCLGLTPDQLLGNVNTSFSALRKVKQMLRISSDTISEATGMSLSKLKEIEAGGSATTAELRDIACFCGTSVRAITGNGYFIPAVNRYYLDDSDNVLTYNWGHVGILEKNRKDFLWFPITVHTKYVIEQSMDKEYMVFPTLNNRLLFLNMTGIDTVLLLDEADNAPSFANWDPNVSTGEIPAAIYEILTEEEYDIFEDRQEDSLSLRLYQWIQEYMKQKKIDENSISFEVNGAHFYFQNGNYLATEILFEEDSTIDELIKQGYEMGTLFEETKRLYFICEEEVDMYVNIDNISMIDFPLAAVEKLICEYMFE